MRLPCGENALVEERKIIDYLLNSTHPEGMAKARFFVQRGYRYDDWEKLAADLRQHGLRNEVARVVESPFGTRYSVHGPLITPSGDSIRLITVWIIEKGTEVPRLVTAYPE